MTLVKFSLPRRCHAGGLEDFRWFSSRGGDAISRRTPRKFLKSLEEYLLYKKRDCAFEKMPGFIIKRPAWLFCKMQPKNELLPAKSTLRARCISILVMCWPLFHVSPIYYASGERNGMMK